MSYTIASQLNLANSSVAVTSLGTQVVLDALKGYFDVVNADLSALSNLFVDSTLVEKPQMLVREDGSGYLQIFDPKNGNPESVDVFGSHTLGFPLYSQGRGISGDRITLAYMTVADLDQKLRSVVAAATNTYRRAILTRLFASADATYIDDIFGSVTVKPLANGDTQTYNILGTTPAADTHQLYPNYALTSVSSTNNPLYLIREELLEHLGSSEILYLAAPATVQQLKTTFSSDYVSAAESGVTYRTGNTAEIGGFNVPGMLVGKFASYGWISEWRNIPANYMLAIALSGTRPLAMRVDPSSTGIPRGLHLYAEDMNTPFKNSYFDWRFGLGGLGRVSACVLQFGTGGSYTAPTVY